MWRPARVAILATILSATGYGIVHLTAICGGSDSYGYVSASQLIRRGQLIQPQPIASWLPVVNPLNVAAPVGYVPAADRSGIAPAYPLGLPVLMALATLLAGSIGPYLVPVVCGLALVVIAGRLGATWYGSRAGWLAAALVAWDALVVTYAKQPMSDVPATMFAVLSVWCLVAAPRRMLAAGLAAGASFLIRPGGLGVIVVLFLFAVWPRGQRRWNGATFIAGLLPFVAAQAFLQWRLFGSPVTSGYGPLAMIYGGASVWRNLEIYAGAIWTIHSLVWFAGLLAAWWARPRTPLTLATATLIVSAVPYVLYFEFDHWETLRFLMPAMVLLSVAAAGGLAGMAARLGSAPIVGVIVAACAIVPAIRVRALPATRRGARADRGRAALSAGGRSASGTNASQCHRVCRTTWWFDSALRRSADAALGSSSRRGLRTRDDGARRARASDLRRARGQRTRPLHVGLCRPAAARADVSVRTDQEHSDLGARSMTPPGLAAKLRLKPPRPPCQGSASLRSVRLPRSAGRRHLPRPGENLLHS